MQYYIKIFNQTTSELVGYYKNTGRNCISKLMNGIKFFSDYESALNIAQDLDNGFLRDKDKKYYNAFVCVYGDSNRKDITQVKKSKFEKEEELANELETFIRQNNCNIER